jgi:hypothetical protein
MLGGRPRKVRITELLNEHAVQHAQEIEKVVETYAHSEVGALDAIDAAYVENVVPLRATG